MTMSDKKSDRSNHPPGKRGKLGIVGVGLAILTAMLVFQTMRAQADEGSDYMAEYVEARQGRVEGSYVVILKDGVANRQQTQDNLWSAARYGRSQSESKDTFSVALSDEAVAQLRRDPNVDTIFEDFRFDAPKPISSRAFDIEVPDSRWGLDRINQRKADGDGSYDFLGTGRGVDIYVMDTGIRRTHSELGGRVLGGVSYVDGDRGGVYDDCANHGTAVASLAAGNTAGVASEANIYSVKVIGCDSGVFSAVASGADWIISNHSGPTVVNMSLGSTGDGAAFQVVVNKMVNAGITVVIAAGNGTQDACNYHPGSTPAAITVGATVRGDNLAEYSNFGSCVDIFAPGTSLLTADPSGDSAMRTASGTSAAAPLVSGAAALHLEGNPGASPADVSAQIVSAATVGAIPDTKGSTNRMLYVTPSLASILDGLDDCFHTEDGLSRDTPASDGNAIIDSDNKLPSLTCDTDNSPEVDIGDDDDESSPDSGWPSLEDLNPGTDFPEPDANSEATCYAFVVPDIDEAKKIFAAPRIAGGCGEKWDDQKGHQCRWVDDRLKGWQCFGVVSTVSQPGVGDPIWIPKPQLPTDRPGYGPADHRDDDDNYYSNGDEEEDRNQNSLSDQQDSPTDEQPELEARGTSGNEPVSEGGPEAEAEANEVSEPQSVDQQPSADCRGPLVPGETPEGAKQAFALPLNEGGCGMVWNDQLTHQCEWVANPQHGWICFT